VPRKPVVRENVELSEEVSIEALKRQFLNHVQLINSSNGKFAQKNMGLTHN